MVHVHCPCGRASGVQAVHGRECSSSRDHRGMTDAAPSIPLYWWRDEPNFGDSLSPWLIEQLLGISAQWSNTRHKLVGLGSVLWTSEPGDIVWGTGVHPLSELRAPDWSPTGVTFLAVRGPLTRDYILERGGVCPELYGDPGELLPDFYVPSSDMAHAGIGIIPHIYDKTGRRFAESVPGTRIIDPRRPWPNVCRHQRKNAALSGRKV